MIVMWEIHIETKRTVGDMLEYFKSKGIASDYRMCKDGHGKISIKHPQKANIHTFNVKLYEELGDVCRYEIGCWTKEDVALMEDWFKDI